MKYLISIFFICICLISCNKDNLTNETDIKTLANIEIQSLRVFLPLNQMEGMSKAIFVNGNGLEKKLNLNITENKVEKKIGSKSYMAEQLFILYTDPNDSDYSLQIQASGNYIKEDEPNLFISGGITQFTELPTLFTISENCKPILALHFDNKKIVNETYSNVFSNLPNSEQTNYSHIYYQKELGIVGFVDGKGEIYELKEFIE
jgi:hypothetical protein